MIYFERLYLRIQESKVLALAIFLLVLAGWLGALAAPLFVRPVGVGSGTGRLWRGYYTLVAPAEQMSIEVEQQLAQIGRLISARRSMVELTRFDSMETLPIAQIKARLDPLDLRYDDYMRRIGDYFTIAGPEQNYSVLYWRPTRGFGRLQLQLLQQRQPSVDWYLVGLDRLGAVTLPLLFSALLIPAIIALPGRRWTLVAATLPWITAIAFGGALLFIAASAQWWTAHYVLRHTRRRSRWPSLLFALSVAICAALVAGSAALIATGGFLCGLSMRPLLATLRPWRRRRRFVPLTLVDSIVSKPVLISSCGALLACLAIVLLSNVLPVATGLKIPQPYRHADLNALSFMTLTEAWQRRTADDLPAIGDYLAHRAYQQALAHGTDYHFPLPGETIYLTRFEWRAGRLHSWQEPQLTFDDAWLARQLDAAAIEVEYGIPELLAAQGGPVAVRLERVRAGAFATPLSVLFAVLLTLYAFVPPFILGKIGPYSRVQRLGRPSGARGSKV